MNTPRTNRWEPGTQRGDPDKYPPAERDKGIPIPLVTAHDWLVKVDNRSRLEDHLDWYLRYYKGRFFEALRVENDSCRFDIRDISAAETLSVVVPPRAVNRLLDEDKTRDSLLDQICDSLVPGKDSLWSCEVELLTGDRKRMDTSGALFRLYYLLRGYGIGPVTTSKLLAAMFPNVVPIRDSKVSALLGLKPTEDWWLAARRLFELDGGRVVSTLGGLEIARDQSQPTIVRRLDIILWMEASARGISPRRQTEGE